MRREWHRCRFGGVELVALEVLWCQAYARDLSVTACLKFVNLLFFVRSTSSYYLPPRDWCCGVYYDIEALWNYNTEILKKLVRYLLLNGKSKSYLNAGNGVT
jgi:hypothetical protein